MNGRKFREALEQLGLTQREAARLTNSDERTARRWALSEYDVPGPIEVLVRTWLEDKAALSTARALADERESKGRSPTKRKPRTVIAGGGF